MELGKLGVWYPTDRLDPTGARDLARRVEGLGYGALWYPEAAGYESFALAAFLLAATERLVLASGIANLYARDPVAARGGLKTLNGFSGGRFVLGLGVSHQPQVEVDRGLAYGRPVATMRAYLERMAAGAAAPVVLAALGPKMLALAASHSRGALPYSVTPEHTRQARAILGAGKWLCVEQKVCLTTDAAAARAAGRAGLERHLKLDNYRNNWRRLGFSEADLAGGGSDHFIDSIVAWGDAAAIRGRIEAQWAAGASHVCIHPLNPTAPGTPDWRLLEAMKP